MKGQELKLQFTSEFFEEFQFDAEFRSIFLSMEKGETPYRVIEYLCKTKKELIDTLKKSIDLPMKIVVTTERLEQLKDDLK